MAYTDTDKIAEYLQTTITSGSTPSETTVEDWINWATSEIESVTGYKYSVSSSTDVYLSTNGSKDVWVPKEYTPLVSISSLYTNTGADFDATWTQRTEGTEFLILDLKTGHLKFSPNTSILARERGIKLTMYHGYSSPPPIVEELATKLVVKQYIKSALSNTSATSNEAIRVGPVTLQNNSSDSISYVKQLNEDIDNLFKRLGSFKTYIY